jgi:glycosyltransferase involved in cell wall biosynthesis
VQDQCELPTSDQARPGDPAAGDAPRLRVCLVSQDYPPETAHGGIGTQTYLKAHGLAALGHEVHVVSRSSDERTHHAGDGPVRVTRVPGLEGRLEVNTPVVDWLTYSTQVAAAVADLHAQRPLDLVDFPEWGCEGYVHLLNRTEWNSIATVVHLHGPLVMFSHAIGWPEADSEFYRVGSAMEAACLRLADRVFSSSRCSAEWAAKHHGVDAGRVPVLHTGVDTDLFRPRRVPRDGRPTVVFVGNLSRNKGVEVLVDAACAVAPEFPGLRVKLIGRGKPAFAEELADAASAAGRPDLLEITGFVAREVLPAHLCAADIFAAPSSYEGGPGFVYLEAMACGLPVIGCSGSGAAEVVTPGETGLLVPPHDRARLADALRHLLGDAETRRTLGAAARRYVEREADSRACVRRLAAFYASVVEEHAAAAGGRRHG